MCTNKWQWKPARDTKRLARVEPPMEGRVPRREAWGIFLGRRWAHTIRSVE